MSTPSPNDNRNDSPRVGYVLRMYPRFSQTFVVNEILELERQNAEVHILSLRKPTDGQFHESISRVRARAEYLPEYLSASRRKILSAVWSVLKTRPSGFARSLSVMLRFGGVSLTDFWQAALLLRWARKRKLAHLHVHFGTNEASVAYLARLMGGPSYSMTLHAFDIFRDNVDRKLLTDKINTSAFTVTVSEYNRRFLKGSFVRLDADKVRVNYNGIDLDRFNSNGTRRSAYSVLGVGRLIEKKGFVHLVRAVGRLRDRGLPVTCTIIGEGPQERMLRDEIRRLDLSAYVSLAGALPQEEVRRRMTESMCFALPCVQASDGNVDALPTVLLEAMASGCPCVSTNISGVPEIIEHECSGLLSEPGDDEALADAMERVLQDSKLFSKFAQNGRNRAEEVFDVRCAAGRMKDWFTEVIAKQSGDKTPDTFLQGDG